jgi:hypothetical protein
MKRIFIAFSLASALLLTQCHSNTLDRETVEQLLNEANAYPNLVDYNVFCGDDVTVEKVLANGLERDGYVTAQRQHTPADIGQPLVRFTEKSVPYVLPTSDTAKSINVQRVKLADERLFEIDKITVNAEGNRALVEYTTAMENVTPFAVMLDPEMKTKQTRETYFKKTDAGWEWEKKIIKTNGKKEKE